MIQAIIIKTIIDAAKRAFWKNGAKVVEAGIVDKIKDVVNVKHVSDDPLVNNELARALAWLIRGMVVIVLVKVAQMAGFDIMPYLHLILESATDVAVDTVESAG